MDLLAGRTIALSRMFPDEEARAGAVKRARAVRNRAQEHFEERGLETLFLACGMATWTNQRGTAVPAAPGPSRPGAAGAARRRPGRVRARGHRRDGGQPDAAADAADGVRLPLRPGGTAGAGRDRGRGRHASRSSISPTGGFQSGVRPCPASTSGRGLFSARSATRSCRWSRTSRTRWRRWSRTSSSRRSRATMRRVRRCASDA